MQKLFAILFKLIQAGLLLLFVAALTPAAWFAWRASQPMERAEFNGLSYYQYLQWRKEAYHQLAETYQANHPGETVRFGMCFQNETFLTISTGLPWTGFYTLAGIYPKHLEKYVNQNDVHLGFVPRTVTWKNFLPTWWQAYENAIWHVASIGSPVTYCRLEVDVPSL